jgi:8-oxo-dGTP diphosphatase
MSPKRPTSKPGKDYIGLGVGAVILKKRKEILLEKRSSILTSDRTTVGMWSIPGGEVEFGETIEDAVKREVKEELGVEIEIVKPIGHWDQVLKKSKIHWHCISFLCKIRSGTPKIMEPEKFNKLKWWPIKKIPKNAGIAHVAAPLYLLGKMSKKEFIKRLKETPES